MPCRTVWASLSGFWPVIGVPREGWLSSYEINKGLAGEPTCRHEIESIGLPQFGATVIAE